MQSDPNFFDVIIPETNHVWCEGPDPQNVRERGLFIDNGASQP